MAHAIHAGIGPATFRHQLREQPLDPGRIAATSAAIVLHAAVFMALLMPASLPPEREAPKDMEVVIPIRPIEVPPIPVEVVQPPQPLPPQPAPPTSRAPVTEPPVVPVATAEPGDLPAQPDMPAADSGPATIPDLSPMAGARLAYAIAPPPSYPSRAVREGRTGTVLLEITVDIDGSPVDVVISRSSGHRDLDRAARDQVLSRWRFQPAMRDGHPVRAVGLVPVEFKL
ncbi:energy transducer TonB [Marilutibacter alkalisoli]|uniref:Energy transducer TonB n=1 Tax=Marilutibacter alkalisoli TaxID=2591633 RepID=A0A514BTM3_9GAMM|nr:energy transducer TonB [Lysobacter alkalisoli]QDH70655.1 energy transducer TonB [Lysobacter alkalisoli]